MARVFELRRRELYRRNVVLAITQIRLSWQAVFTMNTSRLGEELFALCRSEENKLAEITAMFESLNEVQRRKVLRFRDEVSEP